MAGGCAAQGGIHVHELGPVASLGSWARNRCARIDPARWRIGNRGVLSRNVGPGPDRSMCSRWLAGRCRDLPIEVATSVGLPALLPAAPLPTPSVHRDPGSSAPGGPPGPLILPAMPSVHPELP